MSATAQTLTEQAGQLRELVSRFKLGHDAAVRGGPRVAPKVARGKGPAAPKPRPAVARALKSDRAKGSAHELDRLGNGDSDDGFTEF
jgi:methyl-accepting chemotaxis protein